mmetsp:Transcript_22195/g.88071  ORF Transcript_22195/g.88071 Transcript_22195/m.88071 type:complete len:254 (+) Transcript_22195:270-1031(+)
MWRRLIQYYCRVRVDIDVDEEEGVLGDGADVVEERDEARAQVAVLVGRGPRDEGARAVVDRVERDERDEVGQVEPRVGLEHALARPPPLGRAAGVGVVVRRRPVILCSPEEDVGFAIVELCEDVASSAEKIGDDAIGRRGVEPVAVDRHAVFEVEHAVRPARRHKYGVAGTLVDDYDSRRVFGSVEQSVSITRVVVVVKGVVGLRRRSAEPPSLAAADVDGPRVRREDVDVRRRPRSGAADVAEVEVVFPESA